MIRTTFRRIWRMPLALAALIVFGLLAALLGTGGWHVASWAALLAPFVVLTRFVWRTGPPSSSE